MDWYCMVYMDWYCMVYMDWYCMVFVWNDGPSVKREIHSSFVMKVIYEDR